MIKGIKSHHVVGALVGLANEQFIWWLAGVDILNVERGIDAVAMYLLALCAMAFGVVASEVVSDNGVCKR